MKVLVKELKIVFFFKKNYKNRFFVVNPYKFNVLNIDCENYMAGDIIAKNPDKKSITIVCKDKKAIEFDELKLYQAKYFTSFYINKFISLQQSHDRA